MNVCKSRTLTIALLAATSMLAAQPAAKIRPAVQTAEQEAGSPDSASATLELAGRHAASLVSLTLHPLNPAAAASAMAQAKSLDSTMKTLLENRDELLDWQMEAIDRMAPLASQLLEEVELAVQPRSGLRSDAWRNTGVLARRVAQFASAYDQLGSALEKLNRLDEEIAEFEEQPEAITVAKRQR